MRRVLVVGCAGAGKSTVARELADRCRLPLVNLDAHYWLPGWVRPPDEDWRTVQRGLVEPTQWVLDGNYASTVDLRLPYADTVVLLDPPRLVCLTRVIRRWWAHRDRPRADRPAGCAETLDVQLLRYVWSWRAVHRPRLLAAVADGGAADRLVGLRSRRDVRRWLAAVAEGRVS